MNPPEQNEEFYIGWEAKAAPGIGSLLKKTVAGLLLLAVVAALAIASAQRMIGVSVFEWGNLKTVTGVFRAQPYPHLVVPRPGKSAGDQALFSTYYLVAPWKYGLDTQAVAGFDGKAVALKGTLIYRGNQTMLETRADWIVPTNAPANAAIPDATPVSLGRQTLTGEIVDSKCFLGVMNPGQLTPHRACAIRCISGGCPPVLVIRQQDGPPVYVMLVSSEGKPVNQQVLDMVAEPLEISGEVVRQDGLLILRADPATYRRAKR